MVPRATFSYNVGKKTITFVLVLGVCISIRLLYCIRLSYSYIQVPTTNSQSIMNTLGESWLIIFHKANELIIKKFSWSVFLKNSFGTAKILYLQRMKLSRGEVQKWQMFSSGNRSFQRGIWLAKRLSGQATFLIKWCIWTQSQIAESECNGVGWQGRVSRKGNNSVDTLN